MWNPGLSSPLCQVCQCCHCRGNCVPRLQVRTSTVLHSGFHYVNKISKLQGISSYEFGMQETEDPSAQVNNRNMVTSCLWFYQVCLMACRKQNNYGTSMAYCIMPVFLHWWVARLLYIASIPGKGKAGNAKTPSVTVFIVLILAALTSTWGYKSIINLLLPSHLSLSQPPGLPCSASECPDQNKHVQ